MFVKVILINSYLLIESEVFRENIKLGFCCIDYSKVNSKVEVWGIFVNIVFEVFMLFIYDMVFCFVCKLMIGWWVLWEINVLVLGN